MATGHVFHVGTFLLFVATILLLVSTISSPVIHDIALLKITLTNSTSRAHSSVTFGVFGHCVLDVATPDGSDKDDCSAVAIGYDIAGIIAATTNKAYSNAMLEHLTHSLVLHPVATGITFLAFLIAASSHCIGFLIASGIAGIAWLVTLVLIAVDFSLFGTAMKHVKDSGSGATAQYGVATWLTLAAFVILFLAMITTCCACFTDRRRSRHGKHAY